MCTDSSQSGSVSPKGRAGPNHPKSTQTLIDPLSLSSPRVVPPPPSIDSVNRAEKNTCSFLRSKGHKERLTEASLDSLRKSWGQRFIRWSHWRQTIIQSQFTDRKLTENTHFCTVAQNDKNVSEEILSMQPLVQTKTRLSQQSKQWKSNYWCFTTKLRKLLLPRWGHHVNNTLVFLTPWWKADTNVSWNVSLKQTTGVWEL